MNIIGNEQSLYIKNRSIKQTVVKNEFMLTEHQLNESEDVKLHEFEIMYNQRSILEDFNG